ncbi:uncharacterized protein At1g08160-like [Nicotiana tabacum]|uniref:Uncharacterized protein At1g08160-like n=1 Tax=Nicotiana tabacum TaxID=4097 RepID=A0A1S3XH99_TOBAC|nr:PREDICTED: uncharacterized protein At1g08160-like [Nicotiana tabacum]
MPVMTAPPPQNGAKPRRLSPVKCIALILLTLIVIVGITILVIWLAVKPRKPIYSIENASLHGYNMTKNDHLYGNFNFTLKAFNTNSRVSIYYDSFEVKLFYNSQQIAFNNVEPFFQPRRNVTYLDLFLPAKDVALYGDVARDLKTERTAGAVEMEIKVRAKIRFKVGIWKSSHRKLKLLCKPMVPVSSTKSSQTTTCHLDL